MICERNSDNKYGFILLILKHLHLLFKQWMLPDSHIPGSSCFFISGRSFDRPYCALENVAKPVGGFQVSLLALNDQASGFFQLAFNFGILCFVDGFVECFFHAVQHVDGIPAIAVECIVERGSFRGCPEFFRNFSLLSFFSFLPPLLAFLFFRAASSPLRLQCT